LSLNVQDNDIMQLLKNDVNKGFRVIVEKYSSKLYWHIRRLVILHEDGDTSACESNEVISG
jgi:hypothetical protein